MSCKKGFREINGKCVKISKKKDMFYTGEDFKSAAIRYLALTVFLFFFYYVGDFFFDISTRNVFFMFIYWLIVISISDTVIKKVLNSL